MRQIRMSLFVLFILFLPGLASGQNTTQNPNNCNLTGLPPGTFIWRVMAALPAGPRLTNQQQLATYLARADFQRIASGTWGLTTAQVQSMQQAASSGQWQEVLVPACTLFGRGMIFNTPAQVLNSPIFSNWSNWTNEDRARAQQNGGQLTKRAWAFAVSPTKRIYCFEDCSNCLPEDIVPLNVAITKNNDANKDGVYASEEQAAVPRQEVVFQISITNASAVPVRVLELNDSSNGQVHLVRPEIIGSQIPAGASVTANYVLSDYSPEPGVRKINTVKITVEEAAKPGNTATAQATSVVTSREPPVVIRDQPLEVRPQDICLNIEGVQTSVPAGLVRDAIGDCVAPPQPPPQTPPPPRTELIYLTCPDNQVRAFTTAGERFLGTWKPGGKLWQTLLSGGGTAAGSYFLSRPRTLRGRSVLFAIGAKWIVDMLNPSKDKVRVRVNGQEVGSFSEGQEVPIAGFPARMEWDGERAQLIFNVQGREVGCDVDRTKDTINLVFSPETRIVKELTKVVQVPTPVPIPTPAEKPPGIPGGGPRP